MAIDMASAAIMIIDDEPENLRFLGKMLTGQGYTVRTFPNGPAAIASAETDPPDLILLDIRMPGMDGFRVCARLKAMKAIRQIPIMFLTAVDETAAKIEGFKTGAADFITKPFQAEEVLARIHTHLAVRRYQQELQTLNQTLEQRVEERTADLVETTRALAQQIRERRTAQKSLAASEAQYRRIVTTANEGIISVDPQMTITYANAKIAQMVGGTVEEIVGRSSLDFIPAEDHDRVRSRFKERSRGLEESYEDRICRLDGQVRWVQISSAPIMEADQQFEGAVLLFNDVTERKQAESELQQAYAQIKILKERIEADNIYLQEEIKREHNFEEIVGNSDAIQYTLHRVEQVAATDTAVVILGETGTGKELIARAVHSAGSRAERPLVKVNCAALPENLIESELFGHIKGAFTGAVQTRIGRFELAHHGTIFLDEIGELSLALQAKLLRVLQDGAFERLGDNRTIHSDARVIAATNRDPEALIRQGKFRQDLWYRLNVFPITVPPLRDRKEDIPLLVDHFLKNVGKKIGKAHLTLSNKTMGRLVDYDWPGNVRELEHMIHRSAILSKGRHLELSETLSPPQQSARKKIPEPLADVEAVHIRQALVHTQWVIEGPQGAAKLLALHPNTLRYRMRKLGIRRPSRADLQ